MRRRHLLQSLASGGFFTWNAWEYFLTWYREPGPMLPWALIASVLDFTWWIPAAAIFIYFSLSIPLRLLHWLDEPIRKPRP